MAAAERLIRWAALRMLSRIEQTTGRAFYRAFACLVTLLILGCPVEEQSPQSSEIDAGELREHLLKNLGAFADSASAFVVCATDPDLPTDESLAWSGHQIALDEIVETIAAHFGDEGLQFAFQMSTFTNAGKSDFKADVRAQTENCSQAARQRAAEFVTDARNIQERYLALPSDALKQSAGNRRSDSSGSSVPPRLPGETIEQYLKRTRN